MWQSICRVIWSKAIKFVLHITFSIAIHVTCHSLLTCLSVCDECRKQCIYGDCPDHGPLEWVADCLTASGTQQKNQARATLPSNLYLMPSAVGQDQMGVFARAKIEKRVMFGPYKGQTVSAKHLYVGEGHNYMYMWDVSIQSFYKRLFYHRWENKHIKLVSVLFALLGGHCKSVLWSMYSVAWYTIYMKLLARSACLYTM